MRTSEPTLIEPTHDYLGFVCGNCGHQFSIIGPLDATRFPADKAMRIGARDGKLSATCDDCGHLAEYPIDKLIRFSR